MISTHTRQRVEHAHRLLVDAALALDLAQADLMQTGQPSDQLAQITDRVAATAGSLAQLAL